MSVVQRVGRALLIKESDILSNFLFNLIVVCHMEIREQLGFHPTVDGLHRGIISGYSAARHCNS